MEYIAKLSTGRVLGMVTSSGSFLRYMTQSNSRAWMRRAANFVPLAIGIDEDTPNQWRTTGKNDRPVQRNRNHSKL